MDLAGPVGTAAVGVFTTGPALGCVAGVEDAGEPVVVTSLVRASLAGCGLVSGAGPGSASLVRNSATPIATADAAMAATQSPDFLVSISMSFAPSDCLSSQVDELPYSMKPRSGLLNRPRLGKTVGISVAESPNHFAMVALYSSTLVVGIQRPVLVSLGPPTASTGNDP
jgi:hypothetical protein